MQFCDIPDGIIFDYYILNNNKIKKKNGFELKKIIYNYKKLKI